MTYDQKLSIKQWAVEDRPREKMRKLGFSALSDAELIAILIGSGNLGETAVELSRRILNDANNNLDRLGKNSVDALMRYKGIGEAKAINILAALELSRRRQLQGSGAIVRIESSRDAFDLLKAELSHLGHEEFWVVYLDRSNKVIDKVKISQGGISGTVIDVRIILKNAVEKLASSLILAHNHPSGNMKPSESDLDITRKTASASKLLDISLLDHIIVAGDCYTSFADEGIIN